MLLLAGCGRLAFDALVPDGAGVGFRKPWVRPASIAGSMIVFDHDSHWALVLDNGQMRCASSSGDVKASSITRAVAGAWIHVACTLDGATMTVHVGGRPEASVATAVLPGTGAVAIGGNAPPTDPPFQYLGALDSLRVWADVLTEEELCAAARC